MISVKLIIILFCIAVSYSQSDISCVNPDLAINYSCDVRVLPFFRVATFSGRAIVDDLNCDVLMDKYEFEKPPVITYFEADENSSYTLLAVDRDIPGLRSGELYISWIVPNLKGSVLGNSYWSDGVALIEYEKPEPAEDTGVHRLLYLIFEQEEPMVSLSSPGDRKFHLGNWLDENKEKICGPIVASEFTMIF